MKELGSDSIVEADPASDVLDVGVDRLAQVRDLVDEADLGREERVRRIFGELGGAPRSEQDRRFVEIERAIDFTHDFGRARILGADDDPVRMLEILDRSALAQEFRV